MNQNRREFSLALLSAPVLLAALAPDALRAQPVPTAVVQNVFISPCGQPFRAPSGAPYPVADWFKQVDRNGDGKIDHAEFTADAEAFFKVLDLNRDGFLTPYEIAIYEGKIAPEVLGGVYQAAVGARNGLLWKVQMGGGPSGDVQPAFPKFPTGPNEAANGASPFSFFDEPEPVAAADVRFRGVIAKADFLKLSDIHFSTLDKANFGYLTLDGLPKTPMQRLLAKQTRHPR